MKKTHSFYLIIPLVFLMGFAILTVPNNTIKEKQLIIKPSETVSHTDVLWIDKPTFEDPIEPTWYPIIQGDESDVDTSTSPNQANYNILGDSYTFSDLSGVPQAGDWTNISNTVLPIKPDTYIINEQGFRVEHIWDEQVNQTRNRPSARVKRDFEVGVNMSDYIICNKP